MQTQCNSINYISRPNGRRQLTLKWYKSMNIRHSRTSDTSQKCNHPQGINGQADNVGTINSTIVSLNLDGSLKPCKSENDIWMKKNKDVWEYVAVYVDDLAIAMKDPDTFTKALMAPPYNFKL